MHSDPDEGLEPKHGVEALGKLLSALQDKDLNDWDQDFVDDMTEKHDKYGDFTHVSGKQWEQLERMRKQYNV